MPRKERPISGAPSYKSYRPSNCSIISQTYAPAYVFQDRTVLFSSSRRFERATSAWEPKRPGRNLDKGPTKRLEICWERNKPWLTQKTTQYPFTRPTLLSMARERRQRKLLWGTIIWWRGSRTCTAMSPVSSPVLPVHGCLSTVSVVFFTDLFLVCACFFLGFLSAEMLLSRAQELS